MKLSLLLFFLAVQPALAIERANEDNLTQEHAAERSKQVRSVDYELHFQFEKGGKDFSGKTTIRAELGDTTHPLSVDFLGKRIRSLVVNAHPITGFTQRKGSFDIPVTALSEKMEIVIDYVGEFNTDGVSFQHVVDPEDQAEYLYSDFEPFYAHGLFPCLDQPDLKARFEVSVDTPKDWRAISNSLVKAHVENGDRVNVTFERSPRISTYLFFLGVGPFQEWKDQLGSLPLVIYTRKSLARYVDAPNLFSTIKKGLTFYSDYFGYAYPFPKFGLVYIPEFNWGGMENPGAIAVNERGIFRGPVTDAQRHHRDGLILHEMAHMWFGDLVTMRWWNDLWLNESFATYAATLAQDRAMLHKGAWLDFHGEKSWGYWQDQLVTTHPIETEIVDARTVKTNFDGITYAKGASALKQLHFFVGEDGFREGLRSYFKKFEFKNATRADFIAAISKASGKDLDQWTRAWLQTAGPHRVQADWDCKDSKLEHFTVTQEKNASRALSPHRARFGLFNIAQSDIVPQSTADIAYADAENPVRVLDGKPCPQFVFPNLEDHDYALFSLDPKSLPFAKIAITSKSNALLRLMVWNTLGQMVRDSKLRVSEFFETVLPAVATETDESLLDLVLSRHGFLGDFYWNYLTPKERTAFAPQIEAAAWKRLQAEKPGSNLYLQFIDFYVGISDSSQSLEMVRKLLPGLDQDRRWAALITLATHGVSGVRTLISAEEKRDPTTQGKRNATVARVSLPEAANKEHYWSEFRYPERIAPGTFRNAVQRFHNPDRPDLSERFVDRFFSKVQKLDWTANDNYVEPIIEDLFPKSLCTAAFLKKSEIQLKAATNLTSIARRAWIERNDELARCVRVRDYSIKPTLP